MLLPAGPVVESTDPAPVVDSTGAGVVFVPAPIFALAETGSIVVVVVVVAGFLEGFAGIAEVVVSVAGAGLTVGLTVET